MARRALELALVTDRDDPGPLTSQIAGQLRDALADGRLATGERLPSTRMLADLLGVSRTVVTGAYAQLFAEGWVEGRHGSGTYVADGALGRPGVIGGTGATGPGARWEPGAVAADRAPAPAVTPLIDLRPGIAWTEGIDRVAWRRAWRSAGASMTSGLPDPQGSPGLRAALSGYLRRSRGVSCSPGQLVVTRGVAGSLGLIAATLLRPGDRVGVEEPGYPAARAVFAAHGLRLVPCPVDSGGLRVDALPDGLRLVYVTPAHQYPLGGRLSVPRRRALTSWARATGALVVEDDYDGEFRYDVAPLPALFGLDPEVVVYLGTATKILTPAMRVGWLAASPGLAGRLAAVGGMLGESASGPGQDALLSLIVTGGLERHIRRMRHDYARRRAAITAVFGDGAAGRLLGDEAGMHMVLETSEPAAMVAAVAAERGVAVATLDRYFGGPVTRNGLVLGYGGARLPDVARGCEILAGVIGQANGGG
jgi:GntR family transcriptional regulator/MocR family aminotransferase